MLESISDPVAEFVGSRRFQLVIDGELCEAASGETFESFDPSTGDSLTHVPLAGADDVGRAVAAA